MVDKIISSQVNFEILSHEGNSVTIRKILAEERAKKVRIDKGQTVQKVVIECFSGSRLMQLKKAQLLSIKKQKKKSMTLEHIIARLK